LSAAPFVPHGEVVGIDHSLGMLEQARTQLASSYSSGVVRFRQMDAECLDIADHSFDAVTSLFALLHFPNPESAIHEMHRVLAPGGRVVIGVGQGAPLFSWHGLMQGARRARELVLIARKRVLRAPEFLQHLMREHGLEPSFDHPQHRVLPVGRMLREAGFRRVRAYWTGGCALLNADEFWRLQITFDSPSRIGLEKVSPQRITALKEDFLARCQEIQEKHGTLVYRYGAAVYVGRRV
jgi:SAM-dependent methyltransferase